jgi:hypothetical protein
MKVLFLYHAGQTYTESTFINLDSFLIYSKNSYHFIHINKLVNADLLFNSFDAVLVHYTVRLAHDQIPIDTVHALSKYNGLKVIFLQDEYDCFLNIKILLNKIKFNLVFTVVPTKSIETVYPAKEFPNIKFISILTGYASEINVSKYFPNIEPAYKRNISIGYRGRLLPEKYGLLGEEKYNLGIGVKKYCEAHAITHDIQCNDEHRIYGREWYRFIASCKAMLGSESGCNVFDWDGKLENKIREYRLSNPGLSRGELWSALIKPMEVDGLMNQISPKIFEYAALGSLMVLYEGSYSEILKPDIHYFSLRKDLSNMPDLINFLKSDKEVQRISRRAREDLIDSNIFSYRIFVQKIDFILENNFIPPPQSRPILMAELNITRSPIRGPKPFFSGSRSIICIYLSKLTYILWSNVPKKSKPIIKKILLRP